MPIRAVATVPLLASSAALVGYVAFRLFDRLRGGQTLPTSEPEHRDTALSENAIASESATGIVPAEERAGARSEAEALNDSQWLLDEPDGDFEAGTELPLSVDLDLDSAGDELEAPAPEDLGAQWLMRATDASPPARDTQKALDQNVAAEIVGQSSLTGALGSAGPVDERRLRGRA